jgi:hypothetical protein
MDLLVSLIAHSFELSTEKKEKKEKWDEEINK